MNLTITASDSLKMCYLVCVSWINLSDGALNIVMAWILQIKIWSTGLKSIDLTNLKICPY